MSDSFTYEKRTYKSFFLLLLATILVSTGVILLSTFEIIPIEKACDVVFALVGLFLIVVGQIIKKYNRVYWISGISYNDACNMSEDERKKRAEKLCDAFTKTFTILIIYLLTAIICGTPFSLDVMVFLISIIYGCIRA